MNCRNFILSGVMTAGAISMLPTSTNAALYINGINVPADGGRTKSL
jgi:hypothetical protein